MKNNVEVKLKPQKSYTVYVPSTEGTYQDDILTFTGKRNPTTQDMNWLRSINTSSLLSINCTKRHKAIHRLVCSRVFFKKEINLPSCKNDNLLRIQRKNEYLKDLKNPYTNYYSFPVSRLGYINFDVYPPFRDAKKILQEVVVNQGISKNTSMMIVFKEFRSVVSNGKKSKTKVVFSNLPKDAEAYIVVIQLNQQKEILYSIEEVKLTNKPLYIILNKVDSVETLNQKLEQINN